MFNKASGVSSTPTAAKLATPAAASGTPAPQQPSQAIPTPRTEPPRYLLDGTPAGPPGSTPPVQGGPAAPAAATGPMSALPYAQPTLANNMTGLGPRILAALNPTAGSTA